VLLKLLMAKRITKVVIINPMSHNIDSPPTFGVDFVYIHYCLISIA